MPDPNLLNDLRQRILRFYEEHPDGAGEKPWTIDDLRQAVDAIRDVRPSAATGPSYEKSGSRGRPRRTDTKSKTTSIDLSDLLPPEN